LRLIKSSTVAVIADRTATSPTYESSSSSPQGPTLFNRQMSNCSCYCYNTRKPCCREENRAMRPITDALKNFGSQQKCNRVDITVDMSTLLRRNRVDMSTLLRPSTLFHFCNRVDLCQLCYKNGTELTGVTELTCQRP